MLTFIDFFAGIGGFRRGMELAGHKCVGFCEFDKFALASYTAMHLMTEEEREYIAALPKNKRVAEAGKEEYRHGEWYANDIRRIFAEDIPRADCWCFGFPCQDISVAGKQLGFKGQRSSLFFRVIRLIQDLEEKDRPTYLFIENVKNLLSVNGGTDFLKLLIAMDESGYDAEWKVINSADYVPQNRERVFIIGHLRGRGTKPIFPIEGADGENTIQTMNINDSDGRERPQQDRVYDASGIIPALNAQLGGRNNIAIPALCDMSYGAGLDLRDKAFCLQSRYHKGICSRTRETSGVVVGLKVKNATKQGYIVAEIGDSVNLAVPESKTRRGRVGKCAANKLDTSCDHGVVVPVLTQDGETKRQNGRRCKENGEPMFTLTGQDRHGVLISLADGGFAYGIWYEKYGCYVAIRKLTPKECFRLQGWDDTYFDRAALVNSDNQLYKQAWNSVTVPVIREIAAGMRLENLEG